MLGKLKRLLIENSLTSDEESRVNRALHHINSAGFDPWGVEPEAIKSSLIMMRWLYRHYFRVKVAGIEGIPPGRAIFIANHGGQLPIDGMLVALSLLLDAEPPRVVRGMVERWAPTVPFVSTLFSRAGQVVGDHRNCRSLLEAGESVMVFPEGVGGSGKTIQKAYQLQNFGTGFIRLALETRTPIVPVAVIGSEETYPSIYNADWLAKMIGAPYIPVTPFFPLLGPLGALPLPCKITLRFGKPLQFDNDPDAPEAEVESLVGSVKKALQDEINKGLRKRGGKIFTGSGA